MNTLGFQKPGLTYSISQRGFNEQIAAQHEPRLRARRERKMQMQCKWCEKHICLLMILHLGLLVSIQVAVV